LNIRAPIIRIESVAPAEWQRFEPNSKRLQKTPDIPLGSLKNQIQAGCGCANVKDSALF